MKAGMLPVWRARDTLQFGVDPRRAVALRGMGEVAAIVSLLDGSRDRSGLIDAAREQGVPAQAAGRVLGLLAAAGVLDDFPAALHAGLADLVRGPPRPGPAQ